MSRLPLFGTSSFSIFHHENALFEDLNLSIFPGQIIALAGANGTGKSTFLRWLETQSRLETIFQGDQTFRCEGRFHFHPALSVSSMPQMLQQVTLPHLQEILSEALAGLSPEREASLIPKLLTGMGLDASHLRAAVVSDGCLQKLALCEALTRPADLFLLDEPTNYLDLQGLQAVEQCLADLRRSGAAILLVTHDRRLTQNLADETFYLSANGVFHSLGGWNEVSQLFTRELEGRHRQARQSRKRVALLEEDGRRKMQWAQRKERQIIGGGAAKGHISRIAKKLAQLAHNSERRAQQEIDRLNAVKPFIPKQVRLAFPENEVKDRLAFSCEQVSFSYPPNPDNSSPVLLQHLSCALTTASRVCLQGGNGEGKTTFFRLLTEELQADSGRVYHNPNVKQEWVKQGLHGFWKHERLIENFADLPYAEHEVRQFLGAALIRAEKGTGPVAHLSYGEQMRAALVRCILARVEFLLLDEPTSHLDVESIEVLEELLKGFPGGFCVISHDRLFIERVAETTWVLKNGTLEIS